MLARKKRIEKRVDQEVVIGESRIDDQGREKNRAEKVKSGLENDLDHERAHGPDEIVLGRRKSGPAQEIERDAQNQRIENERKVDQDPQENRKKDPELSHDQ